MGQQQSLPKLDFLLPSTYTIHQYIPNTLIHQPTRQLQTILGIPTHTKAQRKYYDQLITQYQRSKCRSIIKLSNWYKYKQYNKYNDYCAESIDYYMIMEGSWAGYRNRLCQNLMEYQYRERKKSRGGFSIEEVYNIVCCMLCGTKQYYQEFEYSQWTIDKDMIYIDDCNGYSLTLMDPFLCQRPINSANNLKNKYLAPEKVNFMKQSRFLEIDDEGPSEYLSQLYTIGVIGAELFAMNYGTVRQDEIPKDGIHLPQPHNKSQMVIKGLQALLSKNPSHRKSAYNIMNVICNKKYSIQRRAKNEDQSIGGAALKIKRSIIEQEKRNKLSPFTVTSRIKKRGTFYEQQIVQAPTIKRHQQFHPHHYNQLTQPQYLHLSPHLNKLRHTNRPHQSHHFSQPQCPINQRQPFESPNIHQRIKPQLSFSILTSNPPPQNSAQLNIKQSSIFMKQSYPSTQSASTFKPIPTHSQPPPNIKVSFTYPQPQPQYFPNTFKKPVFSQHYSQTPHFHTQFTPIFGIQGQLSASTLQPEIHTFENALSNHRQIVANKREAFHDIVIGIKEERTSSDQVMNENPTIIKKNLQIQSPSNKPQLQQPSSESQPPYQQIQISSQVIYRVKANDESRNQQSKTSILDAQNPLQIQSTKFIRKQAQSQIISDEKNIDEIIQQQKPIQDERSKIEKIAYSPSQGSQDVIECDEKEKEVIQFQGQNQSFINQLTDEDSNLLSPKIVKNQYRSFTLSKKDEKPLSLQPLDNPDIESGLNNNSHQLQQSYRQSQIYVNTDHQQSSSNHRIERIQMPQYTSATIQEESGQQQNQEGSSNNRSPKTTPQNLQYVEQQYQTGSKYEGFKLDGVRTGAGKFYYQDGGHYDGQWKNNKMYGWGKLYYENGQLAYQGYWVDDEFHGHGKVYNDEPQQIEEQFDYTNFDLLGDYWYYYEGNLVNDTKEGRGKIILTNGQIFQGDFLKDKIQGSGKYLRRDGIMIEGIWRNSRLAKVISSRQINSNS